MEELWVSFYKNYKLTHTNINSNQVLYLYAIKRILPCNSEDLTSSELANTALRSDLVFFNKVSLLVAILNRCYNYKDK